MGNPILFQWIEKLKDIELASKKLKNFVCSNVKVCSIRKETKIDSKRLSREVVHGTVIKDRKSVFQGHACTVQSEDDVRNFLDYLKENKKISQATHNIFAYRITKNTLLLEDCEDDGENNASKRLLHLLQILNLENIMIVVSRWYGGIHLGPDRFKHITDAARQALVQAGVIE